MRIAIQNIKLTWEQHKSNLVCIFRFFWIVVIEKWFSSFFFIFCIHYGNCGTAWPMYGTQLQVFIIKLLLWCGKMNAHAIYLFKYVHNENDRGKEDENHDER